MKQLFILFCLACLPASIVYADVVSPAHFHTVSDSGTVGSQICGGQNGMVAGETCILAVIAQETAPYVLIKDRAACTVRQTEANTTQVQVGQGGDFFTPASGHTITVANGWINLGEGTNPEAWQAFQIDTTVFNTIGEVYATCK